MILKLYKSYQPGALFLLPFLVFGFWFFGGENAQEINPHPIQFLSHFLDWVNDHRIWRALFGTIVTITGALIINQLFNRHHFIDRDIYLPAFFFSIGFSSIPGNLNLSCNHFAIILLLLAVTQLMSTSRAEDAKRNVFNAGLFIGVALIFQPGVFPFALLPWLTLIIVRPFKWREIIIPILGVVVPLLYLLTYFLAYYNFDQFIRFLSWGQQLQVKTFYSTYHEIVVIGGIIFALFVLVAAFSLISAASHSGLRFKKIVRFTMSLLFVGAITAILDFFRGYNIGGILIFVIPLSFILPHFIARIKNQFLAGLIFYTGFLMVILNFLIIHYL